MLAPNPVPREALNFDPRFLHGSNINAAAVVLRRTEGTRLFQFSLRQDEVFSRH
jgi:hypothetical protein